MRHQLFKKILFGKSIGSRGDCACPTTVDSRHQTPFLQTAARQERLNIIFGCEADTVFNSLMLECQLLIRSVSVRNIVRWCACAKTQEQRFICTLSGFGFLWDFKCTLINPDKTLSRVRWRRPSELCFCG